MGPAAALTQRGAVCSANPWLQQASPATAGRGAPWVPAHARLCLLARAEGG
jgi:hypothetical protein